MEITVKDISELGAAARQFIAAVGTGRCVAFYAPMGAGKTTFVKAVCEALGVTDVITSPTFAIVNEYTGLDPASNSPMAVYHFDFYRVQRIEEAYDMGFDDYFNSGATCFIEWPELVEALLPDNALRVTITAHDNGSRTIAF